MGNITQRQYESSFARALNRGWAETIAQIIHSAGSDLAAIRNGEMSPKDAYRTATAYQRDAACLFAYIRDEGYRLDAECNTELTSTMDALNRWANEFKSWADKVRAIRF